MALAELALAQHGERRERSGSAAGSRDSIIVLGDREELAALPGGEAEERSVSRSLAENAEMFLRCAKLPGHLALSEIIDGPPQAARTQHALHRFIARNKGCYPGYIQVAAPELGACNPWLLVAAAGERQLCRVTFDRGELFERVLVEIVGDLRLTREDTFDRSVRERFAERESQRNRGREPNGRRYFDVAACMVQIVPEQGVVMVLSSPGSDRAQEAMRRLIDHGAPCVGYAKEVRANPDQFRAYVAEALYSWLAAARGVESLILPANALG